MKTKALFVIAISVLALIVNQGVKAQEKWEMINDFEGEGLKKGGVFTLPILEDQSGNIWFATNSGNIYKHENSTSILTMDLGCQTPLKQKKLNTEDCYKLFKDSKGNLWLTTKNSGISRYINNQWENITEEAMLPSKKVTFSYEDSNGNIWFGTNKGAAKFDGQNWDIYSELEGFTDKEIVQIIEDKNGNIWFNSKEAIFVFDEDAWEKVSDRNITLTSGSFREIFVATNGNVWVVSAANVSVYDGRTWIHFGNTLDKVELEEFKEVVGGTYYKLDKPIIVNEDSNNNIWIAYKNGVSRYDGSNWTSHTSKDGLPDKWQLNWLIADEEGNIYVGPIKNDGLLYKYNGNQWEHLKLKGEKFIVSLHIDREKNLWLSGAKGLHKIEEGKTESEILQKPDFGYMYNGIYEANNNVIWFGLQGFKSRVLKYTPPN